MSVYLRTHFLLKLVQFLLEQIVVFIGQPFGVVPVAEQFLLAAIHFVLAVRLDDRIGAHFPFAGAVDHIPDHGVPHDVCRARQQIEDEHRERHAEEGQPCAELLPAYVFQGKRNQLLHSALTPFSSLVRTPSRIR